jgi:hypothetical protein
LLNHMASQILESSNSRSRNRTPGSIQMDVNNTV